MIRREMWSTPTATQQEKGQRWGTDQGSHEIQKPASVGTVVRSTSQKWFDATTGCDARCGPSRQRHAPGPPLQHPANRRPPEMQARAGEHGGDPRRPHRGQSTFSRRTRCATRSGNRFTGSGVWTSADGPSSLSRIIQEATVAS